MRAHNLATGEWNDSLIGDYLWTSTNFGEAFPDVMTPLTWSMAQKYIEAVLPVQKNFTMPMMGNIAGRLYFNISLGMSLAIAIGLSKEKLLRRAAETFGRIPPQIEIPIVPVKWSQAILRYYLPMIAWSMKMRRTFGPRIPAFVAETPAVVEMLERDIQAAYTPTKLLALWQDKLEAHFQHGLLMLAIGLSEYRTLSRQLHIEFERIVGDADANVLLSGYSAQGDYIASLGLLAGLLQVKQGKLSRQAFLQDHGHRGPHEFELSTLRPKEDPAWIDQQLAQLDLVDVPALLAEQRQRHQAAWKRLQASVSPCKAKRYRPKLDRLIVAAKTREASRSEVVRLLGVLRTFALHAGELTGLAQDVFFLSLDELLALLDGDTSTCALIPARKETHARYSALPPYPTLICGHFAPFAWAAHPNRRSDLYDGQASSIPPGQHTIAGFAGAAGIVEGRVRRLDRPEEGDQLQTGEILVTSTTNIGWTPLFSRVAAIVTDIGAPLSHAAIVARELGIPAVVGCGNATTVLHTGDRVRVDGGRGIVERLDANLP
ncbi:MAG: hypothetical protein JW934_12795 [Anaerolineae bacterium]|nr:hypothetical protein [Anaerolineae bacterium]